MLIQTTALAAFGALSQETRLAMIRLLVRAGPDGLAAGALGEAVGASSSKLSFHLRELERAQLVTSRREGRAVIYAAHLVTLSGLVQFLMQDCCEGRPEICAPAMAALSSCLCQPEATGA